MNRKALAPLLLLALLVFAPTLPAKEPEGFFTEDELRLIDDALDLLNMNRADLEFDKLTRREEMRRFRMKSVDEALEHPLRAADIAWDWAKRAAGDPGDIVAAAAAELPAPEGEPLTAEERDRLAAWARAALSSEEGDDDDADALEMLDLAKRARIELDIEAAVEALEKLGEMREPGEGVVIAGEGDDVHDLRENPPRILIDKGGNDRYIAPARATPDHPVAIVIDLGGNDVYGDGEDLSCGAALFGVALLVDVGDGDDQYRSGNLSQGCGVFGVGVLIDEGGSDVYRMKDTGQGAGAWGIGLLLDRGEGNDSFHADLFGQGFAYVGGFGLLHNEKGNDVYDAGGEHLHYPLFNDRYQSLSQGFSIGMRPHASGGMAFLIDDAGNDRYLCDIYGQGAAYWFAYGALVDRDGNDTYNLGQYGQGGGIHLAAGCLIDLAGQDLYYNMHGVGTGGAHDFAVGLLVDRAGDDYYAGSGGTMGGALTNSFALLLDGAGSDGYCPAKVTYTEGGGRSARGMGSIGILIDRLGKDLRGTREKNGTVWTKETYGAGIDLADPPAPEKKPGREPQLTPEEIEERIAKEAGDDFEKLWTLSCKWQVGEMADVVPVAREKFCALGKPALDRAMERIGTGSGLELRAVQDVLKHFREQAIPLLAAALTEEDLRRRARAASLLADLKAVDRAAAIVPLLDDEKTRLGALDALGRLGATGSWKAVAKHVTDKTERVRVTALRCLQKLGAKEAAPVVASRLAPPEVFTVRYAAEDVLVALKAYSLLAELARGGDLMVRRHAVRALGRLGDPMAVPMLVSFLDEGDWRMRFTAAGALAAFDGRGPEQVVAKKALAERARVEENPYVQARLAPFAEEK